MLACNAAGKPRRLCLPVLYVVRSLVPATPGMRSGWSQDESISLLRAITWFWGSDPHRGVIVVEYRLHLYLMWLSFFDSPAFQEEDSHNYESGLHCHRSTEFREQLGWVRKIEKILCCWRSCRFTRALKSNQFSSRVETSSCSLFIFTVVFSKSGETNPC